MSQAEIDKIKEDILILQYRMGGAEYLIRTLVQRMHENEIKSVESEINQTIANYGANSAVAKVLEESLRLLSK
ncbi:hypothetical protein D7S44_08035 [Pantoea piersonii]|nr:hypothetical protein D7S44_08035 [Pantoea piersonii]